MFYSRQKTMLALLDALGGDVAALDFQKLLFLYSQEVETEPSYEFVPYKFGGFSFTSYADKRKLQELGILDGDAQRFRLTQDWRERLGRTVVSTDLEMIGFAKKYENLRGNDLVGDVYRRYPWWATRSQIARKVLSGDAPALAAIEGAMPSKAPAGLCSIGYEGHTIESYVNTLLKAGVTLLCDVRKNPISRKYGFSRTTLSHACEEVGIAYRHLPQLGIESSERRDLHAQADYDALFTRYGHVTLPQAVGQLEQIAAWIREGSRVAVTCYERDPAQCHRTLVAGVVLKRLPTTGALVNL
ncbi:MAG: hypothetical protein CVU65_14820 [Deltaproteobacteria bacterium HGW-Deltaproteobacteria-22]|jgi:hypothetical protein|nr:MAG: hypothetical protein CVU65_14820 [Deltaproteobacteria bacterium HGW-Deltaproteobacteria-22]